jgi:hypothetical protein
MGLESQPVSFGRTIQSMMVLGVVLFWCFSYEEKIHWGLRGQETLFPLPPV